MQIKHLSYSLLLLWFFSSASSATSNQVFSPLPNQVLERWNNFSFVGETTLRRYGFHVYDASFWIMGDKSDNFSSSDILSNHSYALSITYARKISAQQLLSSTKKEWQRLGFAKRYPLNAWLIMLENIWPSVEKGDQLIVVVTTQGKTTFFNKSNSLGTIDDSKFGPAFLSIWLDENSRFKKNREELLGE
ncbi:MAG: chalcone isomerase family protein [Gammaproteobacteria bacterium]